MPNRRRRKLSTAMSAVAALAVASPVAVAAISELPANNAQPQHRQFVQAALITDLPGELISALSQGLSQFGVNLPPMPTGMLTGSPAASPVLTSPGLGATGLTSPLSPGLGATPGLTAPASAAGLTPGLGVPGAAASPSAPGLSVPPINATTPSLSPTSLTDPLNTNPGLTGATPGLTSPLTPSLATPAGLGTTGLGTPGLGTPGLGAPGEVPISSPIGLDPMAGTYPILGGDPGLGLGAPAATSGSGGLIGDLSSAANQLGAGQAIDLLKGMVMPAIQSAIKQAAPAAAAAAPGAAAAPALAAAPAAIAQVASGAGA